jgi:hypothetical protein
MATLFENELEAYLRRHARTVARASASGSPYRLPEELRPLPGALAATLRAGHAIPLSLVRDLLALTAGRGSSDEAALLVDHAAARALARMGWPAESRVAFVLLLLAFAALRPEPDFLLPDGLSPTAVHRGLRQALSHPEPQPAPPPLPIAALRNALDRIDDRVLTLLSGLGPAACARDPSLPLAFVERLSGLVPMGMAERELLGRRLPSEHVGRAEGASMGVIRQGLTHRGELRALLPSGWAMPAQVRAYRHLQGELLYRARTGREPPRLRPTVLVLDVSGACVGPVARVLRPAAYLLASVLLEAKQPAYLVAAGGDGRVRPLQHPLDAFELIASPVGRRVDVRRTLQQARTLREALEDAGPMGPALMLLTHGFFGSEAMDVPVPAGLRALFALYPGQAEPSAWRHRCERWTALVPEELDRVPEKLMELMT